MSSATVFKVLFRETLAELTVLMVMMVGRRSGTSARPPIFSIIFSSACKEKGGKEGE